MPHGAAWMINDNFINYILIYYFNFYHTFPFLEHVEPKVCCFNIVLLIRPLSFKKKKSQVISFLSHNFNTHYFSISCLFVHYDHHYGNLFKVLFKASRICNSCSHGNLVLLHVSFHILPDIFPIGKTGTLYLFH